jgi:ribosomal protein S18 acetylase RimI-like enzyme
VKNVLIRKLKKDDTEAIVKIYAAIIRTAPEANFKDLIEHHAGSSQDVCYVAELDGNVVGFMISYVLTLGFGIEKSAWIATLGVDPEHMGQGIGESLAKEIFKLYKSMGITTVYTSVRWDSTDLLSFFKTLGFDRSDFINLRKELDH